MVILAAQAERDSEPALIAPELDVDLALLEEANVQVDIIPKQSKDVLVLTKL